MKHRSWSLLLAGAVILSFLSACAPSEAPTERVTTTSNTAMTGSSVTTVSNASVADKTNSSSSNKTTSFKDNSTFFSLFGRRWESFDQDTQRFLENCGLTQDVVEGNKKLLTYREDLSATDISPFYQTYTNEKTQYSFNDPTGKLTFLSLEPSETGVSKTEDEIRVTARRIADLLINRNRYEEEFFLSDTELYYTEYIKTIHGYQTFDRVGICMTRGGKVKHIAVSKLGALDNVSSPQIEDEEILNYCDTFLRKSYSYERCEIIKKELDVKDGQLLAYYKNQPDIADGQVVLICYCQMFVNDAPWGRIQTVLVPIQ